MTYNKYTNNRLLSLCVVCYIEDVGLSRDDTSYEVVRCHIEYGVVQLVRYGGDVMEQ